MPFLEVNVTKTIEEQKEYIYEDFDRFSIYVANNLTTLEEEVIYEIVKYANNNKTPYNYYRVLRLLPIVLKTVPNFVNLIDRYYIDEQFITLSVKVNEAVVDLLKTKDRVIYLTDNWAYRSLRAIIRTYRFLRASV